MAPDTVTAAPEGPATTPAQAPVQTPAAPAPVAMTPGDVLKAQQALIQMRKGKEDACVNEINQVLAKHGCTLTVGHTVKISLAQGDQQLI